MCPPFLYPFVQYDCDDDHTLTHLPVAPEHVSCASNMTTLNGSLFSFRSWSILSKVLANDAPDMPDPMITMRWCARKYDYRAFQDNALTNICVSGEVVTGDMGSDGRRRKGPE